MQILKVALFLGAFALLEANQQQFDIAVDETNFENYLGLEEKSTHLGANLISSEFLKALLSAGLGVNDGIRATLNEYSEQIFKNLKNLMIFNGLDPLEMEDIEAGNSLAKISLKKGWLQDISSIQRGGDVVVLYNNKRKYLQVTVPIKFDDLQFQYDYSAKVLGLGPTGGIEGKISDVAVEVKLGFNTTTFNATLDQFYITDSGRISLRFNGNILTDWVVNILSGLTTTVLKQAILLVVETIIRGGLNAAVNIINETIHNILHPAAIVDAGFKAAQYFA